jgi:hypothetical protein
MEEGVILGRLNLLKIIRRSNGASPSLHHQTTAVPVVNSAAIDGKRTDSGIINAAETAVFI